MNANPFGQPLTISVRDQTRFTSRMGIGRDAQLTNSPSANLAGLRYSEGVAMGRAMMTATQRLEEPLSTRGNYRSQEGEAYMMFKKM